MSLRFLLLSSLLTLGALADSGSGTTTRYWDCCKPSCAWNNLDQLGIQSSVTSCDINDQPISSNTEQSGCNGGGAFMCSSQSPWAVSDDLAYGFAAVSAASAACCQCYQLTFTSGPVAGKRMIVQATNTGHDVGSTQFDLAMPGGGFGLFDACTREWGATSDVWGQQYGGMSSNKCPQMPSALQPGCQFRWGSFFQGADNPNVNWETVACPIELVQKSGCVRKGDNPVSSSAESKPAAKPPQVVQPVASSEPIVSTTSTLASSSAPAVETSVPQNIPVVVQPAQGKPAVSTTMITVAVPANAIASPAAEAPTAEAPETPADDEDEDEDDGGGCGS